MESAAGDLFVIDAAPERVWCCAVCDVTIKLREGDGLDPEESHAVKLHMAGKPHQKKLRKKAAEEAAAAGILTPGLVQTPEGLVPPPTKRGTKRAADETDTSLFGKQLKCKDASTNAKSVLNELVQQKGWKLSYVHHERYQKVEDVAPGSLLKEGALPPLEFMAEGSVTRPKEPQVPPITEPGEWHTTKKAAEVSAATALLLTLKTGGDTTDFGYVNPNAPTRMPPGRLRWLLVQPTYPRLSAPWTPGHAIAGHPQTRKPVLIGIGC